MFDDRESFLSRALLKREFALDYKAWSPEDDAEILHKLQAWDARSPLRETQAESAFIQTFFVELWGYGESGRVDPADHTLIPKYGVPGEGAEGGMGEADLAAGWFRGRTDATPQLLCEFKDIRSGLEARQNRKGNRSTRQETRALQKVSRRNFKLRHYRISGGVDTPARCQNNYPKSFAACVSGSDASACARLSPRSGGCVRASR